MNVSSRPRRTPRGHLLRALGSGVFLLFVIVVFCLFQQPPRAVTQAIAPARKLQELGTKDQSAVRETIQKSVCLLAALGPAGAQTLGAGVVVTEDGGVLTCLHVMERATDATARFADGREVKLLGYRAVWPELDLALVQLSSAERTNWPTVSFAEERKLGREPIIAVGHPRGKEFDQAEGFLTQEITTVEMTAETRAFAEVVTRNSSNLRWLQHSASLRQGHSGGPLLNERGELLGINVWIDETRRNAYAIACSELQPKLEELVKQTPKLEKLETHAKVAVRRQAERWRISAAQLEKLYDQGRAMQWQPTSAEDYALLQQLAVGLTLAHDQRLLAATGESEQHLEALALSGQKIVAGLRKERWQSAGQLLFLNEHAAAALANRPSGFWACVRIEKQLPATAGRTRMLASLAGFEEQTVVDLGETLHVPQAGEQWIIVGVTQAADVDPLAGDFPVVTSYVRFPLQRQ